MITFAQARRIVENDVPGGAETATVGYESDGRWWPIVLPARLGGRVPGVSKDSGVLTWVSSLDPEYAASRPWGRLDARPNPYTHLPGKHDQRDHGRKGIRKPDIDVTPRTRARRQSADRERRDIEAQARDQAAEEAAPRRKLSRAEEVERARQHLASIVTVAPVPSYYGGMEVERRIRSDIGEALALQAQLTPRTAMTLGSVGPQPWWDLRMTVYANAAYNPSDRSMAISPRWAYDNEVMTQASQRSVRERFYTPYGVSSALGASTAHEFGHHVMRQIYNWDLVDHGDPDRGSAGMPMETARRFMGTVSRALKVPEPDYDAEPDPSALSDAGLKDWYERAREHVDASGISSLIRISGYAAEGGFQELFAEVWREYSTKGRKARTMVKQIGAAMAREAERNAP